MINKKDKLKKELSNLIDTGKSKIMKKYNLSQYDIRVIVDIVNNKSKAFLQENVARLLKDYGYEINTLGVGFMVGNKL